MVRTVEPQLVNMGKHRKEVTLSTEESADENSHEVSEKLSDFDKLEKRLNEIPTKAELEDLISHAVKTATSSLKEEIKSELKREMSMP